MPRLSAILAAAIALAVGAHTPTIAAPQASAPTVAETAAPARLTARLPDSILRAEEAAKINLDYTAAAGDTYYFDADSNPVDKATAGGYYRKTLGKTADGRLVVQDYYQDGDKPQSAPVILKKDANPHSFANDINDSKTVWYRKDGSIEAVQDFKDGTPTSRNRYYQKGILALESDIATLEKDDPYNAVGEIARGTRFYYPDGSILAFGDLSKADNSVLLYYRPDGSPLMQQTISKDGGVTLNIWDKAGKPAANPNSVKKEELEAAMTRALQLLKDVGNEE